MTMTLTELADIVLDVMGDLRDEDRYEPAERVLEMILDSYPVPESSRPVLAAMIAYVAQRPWEKPAYEGRACCARHEPPPPNPWALTPDTRRRVAEIEYNQLLARWPAPRDVVGTGGADGATVHVTVEADGLLSLTLTEGTWREADEDAIREASGLLPYADELRAAWLELQALSRAKP